MICPECKLRWGVIVPQNQERGIESNSEEPCAACRPDAPIAFADVCRALRAHFPERAPVTIAFLENVIGMAKKLGPLTEILLAARKKLDDTPRDVNGEPTLFIDAIEDALDLLAVPDLSSSPTGRLTEYNTNDVGVSMHRYLEQMFGRRGPVNQGHDTIEVDYSSMELRVIASLMQHVDRAQAAQQAESYANARARIDALQELLDGWWCECGCTRRHHLWGPNRSIGVCRGTGPAGRPHCNEFRPRARVAPPGPGLVTPPAPAANPALLETVPITNDTELNATIVYRCSTCDRDLTGDSYVIGGTAPHLPVGEIQCRGCARNELRPAPRCPSCGRRARSLHGYGWECPSQGNGCAQRPWGRD